MSYYQLNKKRNSAKSKNYSKEKAVEYYLLKKEEIKKRYKNMIGNEKQSNEKYQKYY